jgi:predicted transposase YbfD/YdcC
MNEQPFASLEECCGDMPDPRVEGRCEHVLVEIVLISICAVLCGAESWSEVEQIGNTKAAWLKQYLTLAAGIPWHDTFGRVFRLLNAAEFQRRFMRWVEAHFSIAAGQVSAVDGKTLRGSYDTFRGQEAIHLVSAWARASGVLLGQRKVDAKSNEITAVPELLKLLFIKGWVVTVAALNCQKDIAQTIIDPHADYGFALKANHPQLHRDVVNWFAWAPARDFRDVSHSFHPIVTKGLEIRRCWAIHDRLALESMGYYAGWAGLRSVVMVQPERRFAALHQTQTVYYLSSLPADAQRLLTVTRAHWSLENSFHWTLDVILAEDASRVRLADAPENLAVIRHIALNLLKHHPAKLSLKAKRFRPALHDTFLFELLTQV